MNGEDVLLEVLSALVNDDLVSAAGAADERERTLRCDSHCRL
jgi:hypothetical protein